MNPAVLANEPSALANERNVTFLFWERSVLLPFPLGIYTIIYPVPTYACTVYVYTMELGGVGGEELDVIGEVE